MSRYYRNGRDLGRQGTIAWLEKWYSEPLDLEVQKIHISCPVSTDLEHYQEAKKGKQTELHAFLKYAARCWLEEQGIGSVSYERRLYIPDDDVPKFIVQGVCQADGKSVRVKIDTATPRVLIRDDCGWDSRYGSILEVDVLCEGKSNISIEVGATRPYNLLTPLLEGIVQKAVWIPFPSSVDGLPSVVTGYAVSFPPSPICSV